MYTVPSKLTSWLENLRISAIQHFSGYVCSSVELINVNTGDPCSTMVYLVKSAMTSDWLIVATIWVNNGLMLTAQRLYFMLFIPSLSIRSTAEARRVFLQREVKKCFFNRQKNFKMATRIMYFCRIKLRRAENRYTARQLYGSVLLLLPFLIYVNVDKAHWQYIKASRDPLTRIYGQASL